VALETLPAVRGAIYAPDVALLERDDLVSRLRAAASSAAAGAGSLVVVSAEAGAGKTTLVREALAASGSAWGYCEPLSTPRPLGPFRDIAAHVLGADQPQDLDVAGMRERLLERLRSDGDVPPLVIEDAHWIDAASADVLRFLGRRIGATRGLVVVTARTEMTASHPLRRVLGDLAAEPAVVRLDVPPLSAAAVARLVEGTPIDPAEAFRLTRGNAFLVSQLPLDPHTRVGRTVRDAVAARLAPLEPVARELLELLSVIPGRSDVRLLGADLPRLDEAVVGGVVRVEGDAVEFRHELVRLAVERELTPGRRQELHAEALRRMSALGAVEPAVAAFHARRAHDTALAYASERAAAERAAALGSHREAAQHYRRVLADAETVEPPTELARLLLASSTEEHMVGRDAQAKEAARRGVDLLPPETDPLERGMAVRLLSRVSFDEGEAGELAREAVRILEPAGPTVQLAAAYAHMATNRMIARDLTETIAWARKALGTSAEVGDAYSEVVALQAMGGALTVAGQDDDCTYLRRAVERAREAGLEDELGRAYANLVSGAGEARLYRTSDVAAAEALAYFREHDLDGYGLYARSWYARCRFEQGHWREAGSEVDLLLADGLEPGVTTSLVALVVRGRLRARRGEPDVDTPLAAAAEWAGLLRSLQRTGPVVAARAEARWLAGGSDEDPELVETYELAVTRGHPWLTGELGFWLWRHGRLDALPSVAAEPYRLHVGGDAAAAGEAWLALGCPYEAADAWADTSDEVLLRRALEIFTGLGAVPGRRRVERRLRDLGVRSIPRGPVPSTREQPDGLTAREAEVLRWVRAGDTDAEIAERLFLSTRTVSHHVSAVLRKTGARSRRDLRHG
jgi:DNA-binding CsgD family transcriptional regulator/tetratricopeptide (TPR) repeat protein